MSSSPPSDPTPRSAVGPRPSRWWLPRSLTTRLVLTTLSLVALVSVVVGVVTTLALRHFLIARLDDQVRSAAQRHLSVGGPPDGGPGPVCLQSVPGRIVGRAFGQSPGTVIAEFSGHCRFATVVTAAGYLRGLSRSDTEALAVLDKTTSPQSVSLDIGDYRAVAVPDEAGGSVTGLPTTEVTSALHSLLAWELVVVVGGVVLAGMTGGVLVRRQLGPLRRVAATATDVTRLPLESGAVAEIPRVPVDLTDPDTEVGQVGSALNAMLGHVEQALDTRHESEQRVRQFLADASHELRTPLSTILGYAELNRRSPADPIRMTHALGRIQAESARMSALVNDLLLLARLDSGRPLERMDVDVTRLLAEAVNDARVVGGGLVWRLSLPPEALHVEGDRDRLHQVVSNLLANAIRHTPEGTTVTVSAAGLPQEAEMSLGVVIAVHDDGPGLPTALAGKEFERFSRGDSSRTRASGGTGLGLSIVHAIVTAHQGVVRVRSVPGDTTIEIRLPARQGRFPIPT